MKVLEPATEWLFDPTVGKIIAVIVGIIISNVLTRVTRRVLLGRIESTDNRYRLRKLVNAAGALISILLVTVVFSNKLGNLTVAFGMVNKYRIEDAKIEPAVTLVANDNWLEFTIRYVTDFKRRRSTKDILFTRILEEFDATGGKVSMASATFHLVEAPVFNVRLTDQK